MNYIVNSSEMKLYDDNTIEHYGISSPVLMERAALSVVDEIVSSQGVANTRITILCGPGNNGGDGFAIARLLHLRGHAVRIYFPFSDTMLSADARQEYLSALKYQIPLQFSGTFSGTDMIVDALFGTGLKRKVQGTAADLISAANLSAACRIAVDIPSGVSSDSGEILGISFKADLTVTFGFAKLGHYLYPGSEFCGRIVVKDIGIDHRSFLGRKPLVQCHTTKDLALFPQRRPDANKSSAGKLLVIAGSERIAGAAYFSAAAACRTGCGYVKILTKEKNRPILQQMLPQAVIETADNDENDTFDQLEIRLQELLEWSDAVVIGPGIGLDPRARCLLERTIQFSTKPIVVDADALTLLSEQKQLLKAGRDRLILTPHPGEMSRLSGMTIADITTRPLETAIKFTNEYEVILVQKNARTVITGAEGVYLNLSGNDGMATAGSGDVLAGCIGSLLAQGGSSWLSATLGAYLHGLAGDIARNSHNPFTMGPEELLVSLEIVMNRVSKLHNRKQIAGMQNPAQEAE